MIKRMIKSEGGFGLLEAMIILVIASIAISGLFLASMYARAKAVENYHYRSALLVAAGELENIKWYNRYNNQNVLVGFDGLQYEAELDVGTPGLPLRADVSYSVDRGNVELIVAPGVAYDRVEVTVSWKEKEGREKNLSQADTFVKKVILVEDYYYKYGG